MNPTTSEASAASVSSDDVTESIETSRQSTASVATTSESETTVTTEVSVTETSSVSEETTGKKAAPKPTKTSTPETSQTSSDPSESSSSEVELIALPDVTGMYYMDAIDEIYAFFEEHGIDGVCHYCWADHTRDEMTFRIFNQQPAGGTMIDPTKEVEVLLGVYEGFEPPSSPT